MNRSAGAAAVALFVVLVAAPAAAQTEPAEQTPKLAFVGHPKPMLRLRYS